MPLSQTKNFSISIVFILLLLPICLWAQPFPPGRQIAYYPFNGNAEDMSGNMHHGIVNGATLTFDNFGKANSAFYFNGSSNILIEDHPDFDFVDFDQIIRVTISAWFRPINTRGGYLISKMGESNNVGPFSLNFLSGLPRVLLYNETGDVMVDLEGTTPIQQDIWQQIAFTFDGEQVNLFYNGQLEASQSSSGLMLQTDGMVSIGYSAIDNQYFEGAIDDVYFYNYALTDSEISDLYYTNVVTGLSTNLDNSSLEFSIDKTQRLDLSIYPNPFEEIINIDVNLVMEKSALTFSIIDPQGRLLNKIPVKLLEKGQHNLQLERDEIMGGNAVPGLYILLLEVDDLCIYRHIILK